MVGRPYTQDNRYLSSSILCAASKHCNPIGIPPSLSFPCNSHSHQVDMVNDWVHSRRLYPIFPTVLYQLFFSSPHQYPAVLYRLYSWWLRLFWLLNYTKRLCVYNKVHTERMDALHIPYTTSQKFDSIKILVLCHIT